MNKSFFYLNLLLLSGAMAITSNAENLKSPYKTNSIETNQLSPSQSASRIIGLNDQNTDGKLSPSEVDKIFLLRRFTKVDSNNDGLLDKSELEVSYAQSAEMRKNAPPRTRAGNMARTFFGGLGREIEDAVNAK